MKTVVMNPKVIKNDFAGKNVHVPPFKPRLSKTDFNRKQEILRNYFKSR